MNNVLRSRAMEKKYRAFRAAGGMDAGCVLCSKDTLKEFAHWRILENDFPYNQIAATHHMIVPKAHVQEDAISGEAWQEYQQIKKGYLQLYDILVEATTRMKSVPEHFHLHLIIEKERG